MRSLRSALIIGTLFVLAACGEQPVHQPAISFIGIGTGTLSTDLNAIRFTRSFTVKQTQLVAVVSFDEVDDGSTVQASWFSPDERLPPLGRTSIVTQKGATNARFSIMSNQGPWKPSPYLVRIDITSGHGNRHKTASGSLSFFIGMKDKDIRAYEHDYAQWVKDQAKIAASGGAVITTKPK